MLGQATGLGQRVAVFQDLIENTKSDLRSTFLNDSSSSSLVSSLNRSANLPLNFLSSFDETGFRPKVLLDSNTPVPCQELTIYRLSSTYTGDCINCLWTGRCIHLRVGTSIQQWFATFFKSRNLQMVNDHVTEHRRSKYLYNFQGTQ